MTIKETIMLDRLTKDSVSVLRQETVENNGAEYAVSEPHRKAYANSAKGRDEITEELSGEYLNAVMAMWGDRPTVTEG